MKKENKKLNSQISKYIKRIDQAKVELKKAVVGQDEIVGSLFRAIICDGHVLLEGVPGIAKTLIIKSLAAITSTKFSRIQFTPDLLPTDILGITVYSDNTKNNKKDGMFYTVKGPIFGDFILGDEINRSPPKVQSALLEAMQERQVTIGKQTFELKKPFFVLATQNPIESIGTYPLPAAELDRFLFKLKIGYPSLEDEKNILEENMTIMDFKSFGLKPALSEKEILALQEVVHEIYMDDKLKKYIIKIVDATRNPDNYKVTFGKFIDFGGSPRASIGIYIAAKAEALLNNRSFVVPEDVKRVTHDVLRHRILVNYEGQSEDITPEQIIDEILTKVAVP
jgi:MoxR-like ATPase|tara:strand:- start:750 stop:1763 length:1014 start_codon:yes stop_codon:yes gene_type:complete